MEDVFSQNTQAGPDWLAMRTKGIGGSDIGVIMGSNPYKDILTLWEEKTGKIQPEDLSNNYFVIQGKTYEAVARAFAEQKYNTVFEARNFQHDTITFCRASLDGYSPYNGGTVLEIKVPSKNGFVKARNGEIPPSYADQIQWNMLASGAQRGIYQVYDPDSEESIFIPVPRDDKRINELIAGAEIFWACVTSNTPPAGKTQISTDSFEADAEEFKQAKAELDSAKARYEAIKERLEGYVVNNNTFSGYGIQITKGSRKGTVNYKAIPVLKGVDLDKYRGKDIEVITVELL